MSDTKYYAFTNDYSEGCHPRVLAKLNETNLEQTVGYGEDHYCKEAAGLLRDYFDCPEHEVYFFVGGTPANLTVMAAFLKPWQGVIAADTGHVAVHEAGAIEATGHKVLAIPHTDGKLTASAVRDRCATFYADETHDHMVYPGMIYISQPTELGTLYTKEELAGLREVADEYKLPIFMDGARLAMALAAADITGLGAKDYKDYVDLFYAGGTKCGLLFGEALLVSDKVDREAFVTVQKQRVGRLAKGRLLGLQFAEMFRDDLYTELGIHANTQAKRLAAGLKDLGIEFLVDSPTNQLFPILPDETIRALRESFGFEVQAAMPGDRHVIRFVTSWATTDEAVDALLSWLAER